MDETGPTPETRAKLRADVALKLYRLGKLDQQQMLAVEDIRTYWQAFSRMAYRNLVLDGTQGCSAGRVAPLMPLELLTPRERQIAAFYRAWAGEAGKVKVYGTTALDIITSIVVENAGPFQIDRHFKIRNGSSTRIVKEWLDRYTAIARGN